MTAESFSYAAMLLFCLAATLPLIAILRLDVLRSPLRLLGAILLGGGPFLVWDLVATWSGQWWFDGAQTLPWRLGDLPLEEIAFFVVIPLASIITLEAVRAVDARLRARRKGPRS